MGRLGVREKEGDKTTTNDSDGERGRKESERSIMERSKKKKPERQHGRIRERDTHRER